MVSMVKGYKCIVAVSSKSSADKIDMLKSMGAKVYVCPANVPLMIKDHIIKLLKD